MRKKTLKRNATNVSRRAQEIYQEKLSSVNVTLNMLLRKKKDVQCKLEMQEWSEKTNGNGGDGGGHMYCYRGASIISL